MTRQGWVEAREDGLEVGSEGDRLEGRDAKSSGSAVGDVVVDDVVAVLAVNVGWVVSCTEVSTRFATLESKSESFLEIYSAASLSKLTVGCTYLY